MPVDDEGMGQRFEDSTGDPAGIVRLRQGGQEDGEFVSAESRQRMGRFLIRMAAHRIALSNGIADSLRHMGEQEIPDRMAQGVVDDFKTIQVDKEGREMLTVPLGMRESIRQPIFEQNAIGEAGQAVIIGQAMNGLFGLFTFRDVLSRPDNGQILGLFLPHALRLQVNGKVRPIGQDQPVIDIAGRSVGSDLFQRRLHTRAVIRVNEAQEGFKGAGELRGANAGQPAEFIGHGKAIGAGVPVPIADPRDPLRQFQS